MPDHHPCCQKAPQGFEFVNSPAVPIHVFTLSFWPRGRKSLSQKPVKRTGRAGDGKFETRPIGGAEKRDQPYDANWPRFFAQSAAFRKAVAYRTCRLSAGPRANPIVMHAYGSAKVDMIEDIIAAGRLGASTR
jgi:hypothetical protein